MSGGEVEAERPTDRVLRVIAMHMQPTGWARVSYVTIAGLVGVSKGVAEMLIQWLVIEGRIEVAKRPLPGRRGRHRAHRYRVLRYGVRPMQGGES